MAITYTYVDLSNLIKEIGETDLNYAGNWSSGSTYFFGDVVLYSDTRYLALAASTSAQPPVNTVNDSKWSALVLSITGTSSGSLASGAYYLADEAYGLATYAVSIAGTAGGSGDATYAYTVATAALTTAWSGTSTGHEAADIARTALTTSWTGTALANQAYGLATYAVALTGTSAGGDGCGPVATAALETSWVGTSSADAAYRIGRAALETAWVGTASGVPVHSSLNYSGTGTIDFGGDSYKTFNMIGPVVFISDHLAEGKSVVVRIVNSGTAQPMTFPTSWIFVGANAPATISINKSAILSATSFGTLDSSVMAAYATQL